jgi:hypothetical protein
MTEIGSGDCVGSGDNMQCALRYGRSWITAKLLSLRAQTCSLLWDGEEKNPIWRITGISSIVGIGEGAGISSFYTRAIIERYRQTCRCVSGPSLPANLYAGHFNRGTIHGFEY